MIDGPKKEPMEDRKKGFERKYKLDQELAFKASMRCAKLLGRWAAEQLGLEGPEADAYARTAVETALADPQQEVLVKKLVDDLAAKGRAVGREAILDQRIRLQAVAREQVTAEHLAGKQAISPE